MPVRSSSVENSLALAVLCPDEFAYQMMKGPGCMAEVTGEVIHVIKLYQ